MRGFQIRHGLKTDGIVGSQILSAMRISVEWRIRRVEINMERWRWLPKDLGGRRIIVNVVDFGPEIIEGDGVIMNMRVIVGKDYRRAPVFSDLMTSVIFNPYWHVPLTLVLEEGFKEAFWAGKDTKVSTVSVGIYFCPLVAGDFMQTRKMVLLRQR